jgi:lipid kinase YegS
MRIVVHGKVAARADLREAVSRIRELGHRVEVMVTWEAGDAARFAVDASLSGVDVVVAGGGDGTINEVASGILGARRTIGHNPSMSMGIVPLGTANDFAGSAKIPEDPYEALVLATSTDPVSIDVGRVGDQIFVNVATGGVGATLTSETPEPMKKILGGAAYLVTGLSHFGSLGQTQGTFQGPDFEWSGRFLVMAVGNGRHAGGGHVLCPEAVVDDGLLDVRILPEVPHEEYFPILKYVFNQGFESLERNVVSARVPWVDIEVEEPLQVNLDGEPMSGMRFHVAAIPRSLPVHLPDGCPLLSRT